MENTENKKKKTHNIAHFFAALLSAWAGQLMLITISGIFMISIAFASIGIFIFMHVGIAYTLVVLLFLLVFRTKTTWGLKIGLFAAAIPMLLVFYIGTFHGLNNKTRIDDFTEEHVAFEDLPADVQVFFTRWKSGNPINYVGSNGYHLIGHKKQHLSQSYFQWIVTGGFHVFSFPGEEATLNAFVKNAFFIAGDELYYCSDFTHLLPVESANYYKVNIQALLHPEGYRTPHEFIPTFVRDGSTKWGSSLEAD